MANKILYYSDGKLDLLKILSSSRTHLFRLSNSLFGLTNSSLYFLLPKSFIFQTGIKKGIFSISTKQSLY